MSSGRQEIAEAAEVPEGVKPVAERGSGGDVISQRKNSSNGRTDARASCRAVRTHLESHWVRIG